MNSGAIKDKSDTGCFWSNKGILLGKITVLPTDRLKHTYAVFGTNILCTAPVILKIAYLVRKN